MSLHQNNYAFIDSQNLNLSIRDQGWNLDFDKFYRYIRDRFSISQAFLFIGYVPQNQPLYIALQKIGYIIVFKPTLKLPNEIVKGNVDAELVLHTMIEFPNYAQAIVVSGDGDFFCLIEYLLAKKKLCRLIVPNKYKFSSLLRGFNEHITFLNNTKEKLQKEKRGITSGQNPSGSLSS